MHIAKRHRISRRLSTSDTILFVAVYERAVQGVHTSRTTLILWNEKEVAAKSVLDRVETFGVAFEDVR